MAIHPHAAIASSAAHRTAPFHALALVEFENTRPFANRGLGMATGLIPNTLKSKDRTDS